MMRTLAFLLVLGAVSTSSFGASAQKAEAKKTLLIMNFQTKGEVEDGVSSTVNDLLASSMVRTGRFKVMTGDDIRSLLELEAGKQSAGCETESCVAEIAGALGAEMVITGRVGRLGSLCILKLSLIEPATASTLGLETLEAKSVEMFSGQVRSLSGRFTALAFGEAAPTNDSNDDDVASNVGTTDHASTDASEGNGPNDEVTGGIGLGTMMLTGGAVILGAALVSGVATGTIAGLGISTVNDPRAPGADKSLMRDLGPVLASMTVAAIAVAVVGGGVATAGLFIE